jgi:hypothetical protein
MALDEVHSSCKAASTLSELVAAIEDMPSKMPGQMLPRLVGGIAAGQMPYQILLRQAATIPGSSELTMDLARGLPHNVTTQMDLTLWRASQAIRADAGAASHFSVTLAMA